MIILDGPLGTGNGDVPPLDSKGARAKRFVLVIVEGTGICSLNELIIQIEPIIEPIVKIAPTLCDPDGLARL